MAVGHGALVANTTGQGNIALGIFAGQVLTDGNSNIEIGNAGDTTDGEGSLTQGVIRIGEVGTQAQTFIAGIYASSVANGALAVYVDANGNLGTTNSSQQTGANTASGFGALASNTSGTASTADGADALNANTSGSDNSSFGTGALATNTTGGNNTASGFCSLCSNVGGSNNTAYGYRSLYFNTTGQDNLALGYQAGYYVTTGDYNIEIGNQGQAADANTMRIGTEGKQTVVYLAGVYGVTTFDTGTPVFIDDNGNLGTVSSSQRYKKDIQDMGSQSEAILALRPVTFHYRTDAKGTPQYGLVAEEVAKVAPDLVIHDKNGDIRTVRYEAVNAMLLNEFQKQHEEVESQKKTIAEQAAHSGDQQREIEALKVRLNQVEELTARLDALEKGNATN